MKVKLSLKDPDGVYDSIHDSVVKSLTHIKEQLTTEEYESLLEIRKEDVSNSITDWVSSMEYVTIEINTDTNNARVLKQSL